MAPELSAEGSFLKNSETYVIEAVYSIYIYGAATSTINRENVIPENTSPSNTAYVFSRDCVRGKGTAEGKLTSAVGTAKKCFHIIAFSCNIKVLQSCCSDIILIIPNPFMKVNLPSFGSRVG